MLNFVRTWNAARGEEGEHCWDWLASSSSRAQMFQLRQSSWYGCWWISMRIPPACCHCLRIAFRMSRSCPTCMQWEHKLSLSIPYLLQFVAMTLMRLSICNCMPVYSRLYLRLRSLADDDIAWKTHNRFSLCIVSRHPTYCFAVTRALPQRDDVQQWICQVALNWNSLLSSRVRRWNTLRFASVS